MNQSGKLTVTNQAGATVRTAPSTGAGSIRLASAGTVFDFQGTLELEGGDIWAVLTAKDPVTGHPWRYGPAETVAFIAVYVKGTPYCKLTVDESNGTFEQGWNACLDSLGELLPTLRK